MTVSEWLPRPTLAVGITGHRPDRLGEDTHDTLASAVSEVLAAIEAAAAGPDPVAIRMVSALAEGADSIATDAAVARGWALDVVLPFHRNDYIADFAEGGVRAAHVAQLGRARAVFELPGDRALEDGERIAYERAGRLMLAQSDVLVAVWDNGPVRGRGGAAQIVAEAVLQGIPVIQIDPQQPGAATVLWDGLEDGELGQNSIETVPRGGLDRLPALLKALVAEPESSQDRAELARFGEKIGVRRSAGFAYPLLLAVMGVRPLRADSAQRTSDAPTDSTGTAFGARVATLIDARFAHADAAATRFAQVFRSGYVANFALAALAVILALLGLALPYAVKPVLIALEVIAIAIILGLTRVGNRDGWHRRWLDNRALAEQLRCLAVLARIGDLNLRAAQKGSSAWVAWYARATAREVGLPSTTVDAEWLGAIKYEALALIDGQIAYLSADAKRMHQLEHRLHRLGTILFLATAATCLAFLLFKLTSAWLPGAKALEGPLTIAAIIIGAALPAVGSAIYGIRMQGEFAGIARRNEALIARLVALKEVMTRDALTFDTVHRRIRWMTTLLTGNLESWLQTYHARPLALPG
ncbi:MAG: DUF4231 domain-containing protein [Sphingomonadaceae bacterium]